MTALDVEQQLLVAETFGPTLQGEGPSVGQPAVFIRLSRCNLHCAWCDEPHTWDTTRFRLSDHTERHTPAELIDWVRQQSPKLVVITGGEPLLQQDKLVDLVAQLVAMGRRVEIETNGTIAPDRRLLGRRSLADTPLSKAGLRSGQFPTPLPQFNVSPKLAGSGVPEPQRIVPEALEAFRGVPAVFKFVITAAHRDADLAEADSLVERFGLEPVWLMPEGTSRAVIDAGVRDLAEPAIRRGWGLSSRLHIQLWDGEHGR